MSVHHSLTVGSADLVGTCPYCGQPSCGKYDHDSQEDIVMECVNCHLSVIYFYEEDVQIILEEKDDYDSR